MDYQGFSESKLPISTSSSSLSSFSSSSSVITAMSPSGTDTPGSFISLRCRPTLTTLPPEILSKISYNLSLCDYSFLSRTCTRLHQHLFHPSEMVLFLKTRYRLSIQSGSIIIFAYLANMQVRAPLLLERIFEDFFADSPLRLQEEQQWKLRCQQQRQQLSNNTFQLNQTILSQVNSTSTSNNSLGLQRMDGIEAHKAAEKARRQAKWDAVRMLGVLYALDKTHIGPSSSTNALVLSGASDPPEPSAPTTAPVTVAAPAPCIPFSSASGLNALVPVPIQSSIPSTSSYFSYSSHTARTSTTTTARTTDETRNSFFSHSVSASGNNPPSTNRPRVLPRSGETAAVSCSNRNTSNNNNNNDNNNNASLTSSSSSSSSIVDRTSHRHHQRDTEFAPYPPQHNGYGQGQGHGSSHSYPPQEGQDLDLVSRSRSVSVDTDMVHNPQQQQQRYHSHHPQPNSRNLRKRHSPTLSSKDGKMSSSPSSSWWDSPLTHSDSPRVSPSRALSPPSARHHPHHHHRSPPAFSPLSSSPLSSSSSTFCPAVPESKAQKSGRGGEGGGEGGEGGGEGGEGGGEGGEGGGSPSHSSTFQDEARHRLVDRRNRKHINFRRGYWPSELDLDMQRAPRRYQSLNIRRDSSSSNDSVAESPPPSPGTFGDYDQEVEAPMDVDTECGTHGDNTDDTMHGGDFSSSSSSSACPLTTAVVSPSNNHHKEYPPSSFCPSIKPKGRPSSSLSSSSMASCSSSFSSPWPVSERESDSAFGPALGISVPLIQGNTNSSGINGRQRSGSRSVGEDAGFSFGGNGIGSGNRGGGGNSSSSSSSSSHRTDVFPLPLSSSSIFSGPSSFTHPRDQHHHHHHQPPHLLQPLPHPSNSNTKPLTTSTTSTNNNGTQQKMQQILNRNDKIAFLTKYTDRMHLKLQALGIEDWGQGDIQRKKTYQLMIQHNDKTGEKDLVKFYLGRYGGSVTAADSQDEQGQQRQASLLALPLTSPTPPSPQQQQQQQEPVVVQS